MIFAYIRTSLWRKNKVTMKMQMETIHAKLDDLGLTHPLDTNVFEDRGISGANPERPGLLALLERLRDPQVSGSTLIVYRFNRLSRDTNIMLNILDVLEENDIELISVMEPLPSNNRILQKTFIRLYGVVAAFERDVISENIMLVMDKKRSEGKPLSSNTPYGYRYSRDKLLAEESEISVVRYIYDLYLTGDYGYEKISKRLNREGFRVKDRLFTETDIYRILDNRTYCGFLKGGSRGLEYEANHHVVITEEEYEVVQKIKQQRHVKKKSSRQYRLRKKIPCPLCGQHLSPRVVRLRNRSYSYYSCAKPSCKERVVSADKIERQVKKAVILFILRGTVIDRTIDELQTLLSEKQQKNRSNKRQHQRARENLFSQFEKNQITAEKFKKALHALSGNKKRSSNTKKYTLEKVMLEELVSQRSNIEKDKLRDTFYFDLVEKVYLSEDLEIEKIYLKSLDVNILEQEEIVL